MKKITDGEVTLFTYNPKHGDIIGLEWTAKGYEGKDYLNIMFYGGSWEVLIGVPLTVVETWVSLMENGSRSEIFYRDNIKNKYSHPTESSWSGEPSTQERRYRELSKIEMILKAIETLNEKEAEGVKQHATIRLAEIEAAKPWNSRPIPDYLQRCMYPISEKTKHDTWYSDVWYHAAKDGMMGKQISSPRQIPLDATHIIEIHK